MQTTVSYISNAMPIPADKPEIAPMYRMGGRAASGKGTSSILTLEAATSQARIRRYDKHKVSSHIEIPLFVGGGILTPEKVYANCKAGANIIVVGNAIERASGSSSGTWPRPPAKPPPTKSILRSWQQHLYRKARL